MLAERPKTTQATHILLPATAKGQPRRNCDSPRSPNRPGRVCAPETACLCLEISALQPIRADRLLRQH